MNPLFADTGYWIGLFDRGDDLHTKTVAATRRYASRRLVTSEMVLTEFLNHFGSRVALRTAAALFAAQLRTEGQIEIVPQTAELFEAALQLYKARPDKQWSLTDCASFSLCYKAGIAEAFAFDNHFAQAGITPLLRD